MSAPYTNGFCMTDQSFHLGKLGNCLADFGQSLLRKLLYRDHLDEIHNTQPAPEARYASSRKNVIWTGRIVPGRLRGIVTNEDRTSVLDQWENLLVHGDVLGSDLVRPIDSLS